MKYHWIKMRFAHVKCGNAGNVMDIYACVTGVLLMECWCNACAEEYQLEETIERLVIKCAHAEEEYQKNNPNKEDIDLETWEPEEGGEN